MRERACRVGGAKPAAGVCVPKCTACCVEIAVGRRKVPQRSSKCAIALWEALAWAERPPLWGSDDVSAMRNYRYRHRDSPYVAMRSGGTNIPGRTTVGGRRQLPGARWRGRPVCARGGRPCGGSGGTNARVSVFFIHIHPRLRRGAPAGRKGGPISSASGSSSSLCWSWGRRAGRRRRGTARARRGEEHRPCGAARGCAQGREA